MWLHSLKVPQLLRSAACLHTNQSRSYLNHLVHELVDSNEKAQENSPKCLTCIQEERSLTLMGTLDISPHVTVDFPPTTICSNFQIRPRVSVTYVMKAASSDSK